MPILYDEFSNGKYGTKTEVLSFMSVNRVRFSKWLFISDLL